MLSQVVQVTGLDMIGDAYVRHDNPYSAMADLASRPRLAADTSPEYGVARTVRFAAVVGGLVGCAGSVHSRARADRSRTKTEAQFALLHHAHAETNWPRRTDSAVDPYRGSRAAFFVH